MTMMTPTNIEGIAAARAALGHGHAKRRPFVPKDAQRLATMLTRAESLERLATQVAAARFELGDDEWDATAIPAAVMARAHVDNLCLESDLYTHLEAAAIIDDAA